jgi:hypothetical protein
MLYVLYLEDLTFFPLNSFPDLKALEWITGPVKDSLLGTFGMLGSILESLVPLRHWEKSILSGRTSSRARSEHHMFGFYHPFLLFLAITDTFIGGRDSDGPFAAPRLIGSVGGKEGGGPYVQFEGV